MTGLRVYISGPMTGRPNHNKPAFYAAAALLAEAGHIPVNPAEVCAQLGATEWTDCMRADIKALCDCDAMRCGNTQRPACAMRWTWPISPASARATS